MKAIYLTIAFVCLLSACGGANDQPSIPASQDADYAPSTLFDEKSGWATDYVVLIDPTFDAATIYNAQMALQEWEEAVPVHFSVWVAPCNAAAAGQICIHNVWNEFPDGGGPGWNVIPNLLGFTEWANTSADVYIYYVGENVDTNLQVMVLLHECLHAMCGIHHPGPHIMNPTLPPPGGITTITADDANQWFGCRGLPNLPEDAGVFL